MSKWLEYKEYVEQYCKNNNINIASFKPKRSSDDQTIKQISRAIESYNSALSKGDSKYKTYTKVTNLLRQSFPHWLN